MFSGFLKKLLFARQFSIIDGEIKVLGERYVMLPSHFLFDMIGELSPQGIVVLSREFLTDVMQKTGANRKGFSENLGEVFDIFGLGKLEIISLDWKKKTAELSVKDTLSLGKKDMEKYIILIRSVIIGFFTVIFEKEVDASLQQKTDMMKITVK